MANYTQFVQRVGENAVYSSDLQAFSLAMQAMMSMLPIKSPAILGNYSPGSLLNVGALYYNGMLYAPPSGISQYTENQYLYAVAAWDSTSQKTVVEQTQQVTYDQRITYYQQLQSTQVANVDNGDGTGSWFIAKITPSTMLILRSNIFGDPNSLMMTGAVNGTVIHPGTLMPMALTQYVPVLSINGLIQISDGQSVNLSSLITQNEDGSVSASIMNITGLSGTSGSIEFYPNGTPIENIPNVFYLPLIANKTDTIYFNINSPGALGPYQIEEGSSIVLSPASGITSQYVIYMLGFERIGDDQFLYIGNYQVGASI